MNAFSFLGSDWAIDDISEDKGLWHKHGERLLLVLTTNGIDDVDELPSHCECGTEVPADILAAYLDEVTWTWIPYTPVMVMTPRRLRVTSRKTCSPSITPKSSLTL
jgi:hypothetical protein